MRYGVLSAFWIPAFAGMTLIMSAFMASHEFQLLELGEYRYDSSYVR